MGGLLGVGVGAKGMLAPLSNYWGGASPLPPSSYAYEAPEQQSNGHQTWADTERVSAQGSFNI